MGMEREIPILPIYENTLEDEADRRVDQGCGTYSDYGYDNDDDRSAGIGSSDSRKQSKSSNRRLWYRSRHRPYGEPSESDLMYPKPVRGPLSEEQREINRRGLALARQMLADTAMREKKRAEESAAGRGLEKNNGLTDDGLCGEHQGELF